MILKLPSKNLERNTVCCESGYHLGSDAIRCYAHSNPYNIALLK